MLNPKPILGYLVIKNHPTLKDKLPIYEGENTIGRVPQKSNLIIKDGQISSAHAKIKITNDKIFITDIGSKNGTFVNLDTKQRIQKGVATEIKEGESFALGEVQCAVQMIVQNKKSTVTPQKSKQIQQKKPGVFFQLQQASQAYKKVKNKKTGDQESNRSENIFGEKYKKNKEEQKFIRIKKESVKLRQSQDLELQQSESLEIPQKKQIAEEPKKNAKQNKKKAGKQKQEKEKQQKEKKQKQKQEKEKIQLQKKQKQKLSKKSVEELKKKQEEEKLKRQKERQQRKRIAEEQSREESERQREELQAKKKEKAKKQVEEKKNKPKSKQKEQKNISLQKSQQPSSKEAKKQSRQKQKQQKQDKKDVKKEEKKDSKEKKMKKGANKVLQVSRKSSEQKNKEKRKSTSRQTKDKQQKNLITKTRKRAPFVHKDDESSDERKPYRTRQRIIKVTKFMVSGQPITFKLSPMLEMVHDIDEDFDVLVMDSYIRTFKLLFSIVRGIPIVRKAWLVDSQYFKKSMQFENYWLIHPQEKYLIKQSVQKAQTGFKVLNDMKFYVACEDEKLHMPFQQLQRLIYAAGGEVIRSFKSVKGNKSLSKEVIILLDQNYNDEQISTAKEINKDNIYLVELVLQGCLMQQLDMNAYKVKV